MTNTDKYSGWSLPTAGCWLSDWQLTRVAATDGVIFDNWDGQTGKSTRVLRALHHRPLGRLLQLRSIQTLGEAAACPRAPAAASASSAANSLLYKLPFCLQRQITAKRRGVGVTLRLCWCWTDTPPCKCVRLFLFYDFIFFTFYFT